VRPQRTQGEDIDPSFIWTTTFVPLRKVKIFVTLTASGIGGPEMLSVADT